MSIVVAGYGRADRIGEDKEHELALLRIYGARGLKPLDLGSDGATKSAVDVSGIADPQSQGGGSMVSQTKSQVTPVGSGNESALVPSPGLGFSGAAVVDGDGKFAGVALLKPAVVAGSPNGAIAQAALVRGATVRAFLKANGISAAAATPDAKASVVRVICIRK